MHKLCKVHNISGTREGSKTNISFFTKMDFVTKTYHSEKCLMKWQDKIRVAPESGSGQNPAFFPNPAPGKIPPEPDAIAGC